MWASASFCGSFSDNFFHLIFLLRLFLLVLSQMTEERWSFFHSSRAHVHRSSCAATEVERINALLQKKIGQSILGKVTLQSRFSGIDYFRISFLHLPRSAQVHLAMVRYHEGGRFCERDEQWDQESAMFHLETAAMCGELEAIVAIGQCYLQLPHHVLPEMEVEVCCTVLEVTLCLFSLLFHSFNVFCRIMLEIE